ncbi:TolC family protein [Oxalobacteraceae bacterium OTU3CAMAD1]|nr:TolC family protein [Oxalobacteraceae bacterium OTU3CAMAD1]
MRTVRWPALIAGVVLSFPLLTTAEPIAPAAGPTLAALVELAWQRSVAARTLDARQDEASAGRAVAQSWLAGAPTLGLSERSGRWTGDRAQHETEISVAAPVLLPGQQSARQQLAARSTDEVQAQLHRARLEVAGAVRARLWETAAARELLAEKEGHLHHLEDLRDEVRRRVAAGDMARSDGLLADQEVLAAQGEISQARGRLREAMARFQLLTGVAELPSLEPEQEPPTQPAVADHARLRAAEASEQRARAAVGLASASVQGAPTVALSMRRERDSATTSADRSIGIAVHIPLGGNMRNRPAETLAATQFATAAAELNEARASIAIEQSQARSQLEYAREALQTATARAALMREHTALFEKAFKQGERGLAELLRSRTLSHEADVAVRQQRVALGMAHAQLNQVLGILP